MISSVSQAKLYKHMKYRVKQEKDTSEQWHTGKPRLRILLRRASPCEDLS